MTVKGWMIPVFTAALLAVGCNGEGPAPAEDTAVDEPGDGVSVQFVRPADGDAVRSPFQVEMAAEGVEVVPAGVMEEGTGHMHILIDVPFVPAGEVIPTDDQHRHYGDGATSAELDLAPGEYVLRLQFADGAHRGLEGGEYRDEIRVTVTE